MRAPMNDDLRKGTIVMVDNTVKKDMSRAILKKSYRTKRGDSLFVVSKVDPSFSPKVAR